jgi:hypothetical protein
MADERTGRYAAIYGTGDASTRRIRIMGLTRRGETYVHPSRFTGDNTKIMGRVARHGVLPRYTEKNYK